MEVRFYFAWRIDFIDLAEPCALGVGGFAKTFLLLAFSGLFKISSLNFWKFLVFSWSMRSTFLTGVFFRVAYSCSRFLL